MPPDRRHINRQAWKDITPQVRDLFRTRQRELLEEAKLADQPKRIDWGARRKSGERNRAFREFVLELLRDGTLDGIDDDTLSLIEAFVRTPSGHNRIVLYHNLKEVIQEQPDLLDSHIKQFLAFG